MTLRAIRAAVEAVKDTDQWYFVDDYDNAGDGRLIYAQVGEVQLSDTTEDLNAKQLRVIGNARQWLLDLLDIAEAAQALDMDMLEEAFSTDTMSVLERAQAVAIDNLKRALAKE